MDKVVLSWYLPISGKRGAKVTTFLIRDLMLGVQGKCGRRVTQTDLAAKAAGVGLYPAIH